MLEVLLLNNKLTHFVENSNVIWRLSNYINVAFFPPQKLLKAIAHPH